MKIIRTFTLLVILGMLPQICAADTTDLEEAWRLQVNSLEDVIDSLSGFLPDPDNPQAQQELFDYIYSHIAMGYFGVVYGDPKYPDFWPWIHEAFRSGWPNPDDVYTHVPIDDDGVYKISGYRGTVKVLDFQINAGNAGKDGTGIWGPALNNFDADDLNIAENGWFEVILSPTRPEGYKGDWWKLGAGATWIYTRQRSYDWLNEVDGRFGIERIDRPAIQPRITAAEMAVRLGRISTWAETWTRLNLKHARQSYENSKIHQFQLMDFSSEGGFTGKVQSYPQTVFKLENDEALVVETEIPEHCRYWNFQLVDTFWRTLGGINQMNSINAHQAKLDADGKFRFVVSAVDPGVPNWLDNMGYETGFVYGRWNLCSSAPVPVAKKVKVADVRKYLPEDTLVVSAEDRDRLLRVRRLGAQMRKRW